MKPTVRFCAILVAMTFVIAAAHAIDVSFNPQTLVFNPGETTKDVVVQISNIPPDTNVANFGFYFTYDKAHVDLSNPQWQITTDQVVPPIDRPDGMVIMAAAQSNPVTGDGPTALVSLTVTVSDVNPGDEYKVRFKEDAPENGLLDADLNPLDANWGELTIQISAGPPNPPDVTGWQYDTRQRDPVQIKLQLSAEGNVPTEVVLQYRKQGETNWHAAAGAQINIQNKTVNITWDSPTADGRMATYELRAYVKDRTEQTGPWNAPNALTVDNKAPELVSVTGFANTVLVTYSENVDETSATNVNNYTLMEVQTSNGTGFTITNAQLTAPNRVRLTVNPQLVENKRYRLRVENIEDTVGNVLAADSTQFTAVAKPRLERVNFIGPSTIDVVFNGPMKKATVEKPSQWTVVPNRPGAPNVGVTAATLRDDKVTVRLALAAALEQYTEYVVGAPPEAENEAGQTLGAEDCTINFRTPIWHRFAAGVHLAGIPMSIAGRVRALINAAAVAAWDPTANGGNGAYVVDNGGGTRVDNADATGWWVRFNSDTLAIVDGQPLRGDVQVDLFKGWNIITDPYYDHPVDIANVEGCLPFAWTWEQGSGYRLVAHLPNNAINVAADTMLRPWKGYFVKMTKDGQVTIKAQTQAEVKPLALGGEKAVLIQVVARAEGAEDAVNICGVGDQAFRLPNPPRMAGSVDVYFVGDDGEPLAMDIRTGPVTQRWNLVVETDLPHTRVTVATPDLSRIPADCSVVLIDPATGAKTHLRTSAGYVFTTGANGARRKLILEVVPRSQTTLLTGVTAQQVGGARVVVTYQLTGPAAVTAKVLNIAGRVVRTLVTNRAETAGRHTIGWNMDNESGSPVPSGTYLFVLQAQTEDGQQVKVVRPLAVNR